MSTYRYYVLDCDACGKVMGRSTDAEHPSRGITVCFECWSKPAELPRHLQSTIVLSQAGSVSLTKPQEGDA